MSAAMVEEVTTLACASPVHVQFSRMYDLDPVFLPVHVRSFSLG